jgi:membrane-bound ClpP family serine protease
MLLDGEKGIVESTLDPEGTVRVHGETWNAHTTSNEFISVGTTVIVTAEKEGILTVGIESDAGLGPESGDGFTSITREQQGT